jgi:hypothetical protein
MCVLAASAQAKYSGGTGEPNDPYRIATAADLIALGETPEDYDKHFILTTDIDLDPNLPGRRVFDRAVIAPSWEIAFWGVFDGNGHTISNLTVVGDSYLGLFGGLGGLSNGPQGEVKNLGLVNVNITGSGHSVGGLLGFIDRGTVTQCYSTGAVRGRYMVVGGLVGSNGASISTSYSTAVVSGSAEGVGGLVGGNSGWVTNCYSTGTVSGEAEVGGLVGGNSGRVTNCYSTGSVSGNSNVGGLVGPPAEGWLGDKGVVTQSFWDIQTSGQATSDGGEGKTTTEMQTAGTFATWGACESFWSIDDGRDYPRLAWENAPGQIIGGPTYGGGTGTPEDPYLIYSAGDLEMIGLTVCHRDKQFKLMADIDLSGLTYDKALIAHSQAAAFAGVFDGNGHTISHLTIEGVTYLGLFGRLASGAEVRELGVKDVNIVGSGGAVGGLVGGNGGTLTQCYSTGTVSGTKDVGGLVGGNSGTMTDCYSTGVVSGSGWPIGGLVGENRGDLIKCYSAGIVNGNDHVGGLVGYYFSASPLPWPVLTNCFWDIETSKRTWSFGGTGKTTAEMQMAATFLNAGWDFVGETANGTEDIWWILEGKDYPRLWWEARN